MPAGLTATYDNGNASNLESAESGVEYICDYLSDETSSDMYSLSGFTHSTEPDSDDYESYMYNAIMDIHAKGQLMDGDHIVLVDNLTGDGYGRVFPDNPIVADGNEYNACRVSASWVISEMETRYMAMHELGHALDISHSDGTYTIGRDSSLNKQPQEMTLMSVPYIQDTAGGNACRGFFGGRSTPPTTFCEGVDNFEVEVRGDDYLDEYSSCGIDNAEAHLEGF